MRETVFVLGSHVRHVGIVLRGFGWGPLCNQSRPRNDQNRMPWLIAATPAENARPVCARCVREVRHISAAVL